MIASHDIHIRDPFVLPVIAERRYYLYGTTDPNVLDCPGVGFDCFTSADLARWDGPFSVFRPPADFWGTFDFWAPEVHLYEGRYAMLASFKAPGACRATHILTADSPRGPFAPLGTNPVTPVEWECLDGTLFVEDGQPWIVFCHEWVQVGDGEMCAAPLTPNLGAVAGPPTCLFRASDAAWVRPVRPSHYVTDGPFLHRAQNGDLLMLWSSFSTHGYAQGTAWSESGRLRGPWRHPAQALFEQDGGHGMLFPAFDGRLMLTLHCPNRSPDERPLFATVADGDALTSASLLFQPILADAGRPVHLG